jgi:hypothetical protein
MNSIYCQNLTSPISSVILEILKRSRHPPIWEIGEVTGVEKMH